MSRNAGVNPELDGWLGGSAFTLAKIAQDLEEAIAKGPVDTGILMKYIEGLREKALDYRESVKGQIRYDRECVVCRHFPFKEGETK